MATDGSLVGARDAIERALDAHQRFDSVFAPTDEALLGVVAALSARGLVAGRDVKIAGVGDGALSLQALKSGSVSCLVRSPSGLGALLRADVARVLSSPGVSRRLVTSHDVLTR